MKEVRGNMNSKGEQPDTRCRGWRKAGTGRGEDWERGRWDDGGVA
jgi:hypothetical protein